MKKNKTVKIMIPFIGKSVNNGGTQTVKDNYQQYLYELLPDIEPIDKPVRLDITFHYFSESHPDLDNLLKPLIDCLKGKIIVDDRQIIELNTRFELNTRKPKKIVLRIEELK